MVVGTGPSRVSASVPRDCQAPAAETFATNPSSLPADVSDVEPDDAVPEKFPVTIARPPAPDAAASLR